MRNQCTSLFYKTVFQKKKKVEIQEAQQTRKKILNEKLSLKYLFLSMMIFFQLVKFGREYDIRVKIIVITIRKAFQVQIILSPVNCHLQLA